MCGKGSDSKYVHSSYIKVCIFYIKPLYRQISHYLKEISSGPNTKCKPAGQPSSIHSSSPSGEVRIFIPHRSPAVRITRLYSRAERRRPPSEGEVMTYGRGSHVTNARTVRQNPKPSCTTFPIWGGRVCMGSCSRVL